MNCNSCRVRALIFFCGAVLFTGAARGAQEQRANPGARSVSPQGIYLVFPFQNAGASPRLDWLGEGLEELTIQYLSDSCAHVYSHAGRAGELERYRLPASAIL